MAKILLPVSPHLRRRDAMDVLRKYARDPLKVPKLWAGAGDRSYTFDRNNYLSDGVAAISANGYSQVDGADARVDLGGNQAALVTLPPIADVSPIKPQLARIDAVIFITVSAFAATGGISFNAVGSNDPLFGAASTQTLGALGIGASQLQPNPAPTPQPPAGSATVYELFFTNEQANQKYQYLKLFVGVGGTTPSVTFQAFVAVLPEE